MTFGTAAQPLSVDACSKAIGADMVSSYITPVGIVTAPKCEARARPHWLARCEAELLPVPYLHVVFMLPATIGRLARQNSKQIYAILFRAAASTFLTIAVEMPT